MSLVTQLSAFAGRVASEFNAVRRFDPTIGTYNLKASNTRKLTASLAVARAGTGLTRWLVLGDSKVSGYVTGSTGNHNAWPGRLARLLDVPFAGDIVTPSAVLSAQATDPRWAFTSGWYAYDPTLWGSATANSTATYSSDHPGTVVEIVYSQASGSFTYSIDGAAAVTVTTSGAGTFGAVQVTGLDDIRHTVKITRLATGSDPWLTSVSVRKATGLALANFAFPGTQASNYQGSTFGTSIGSAKAALNGDANVVFVSWGTNEDWLGTAVATFKTNLAATIATCKALAGSPDVIIVAPTSPDIDSTWGPYITGMYEVALSSDVALIDLTYLGGSVATAQANGILVAGDGHETVTGHMWIAQRIASAINGSPDMSAVTESYSEAAALEFRVRSMHKVSSSVIRQSMDYSLVSQGAITLTSGRLNLVKVYYLAGDVVTNLAWAIGSTGGTGLTHTWTGLYDANRYLLAASADDTSATRTASTPWSAALTAPYTIPVSGWYYHGFTVVGTTPNSLAGSSGAAAGIFDGIGNMPSGNSSTALTTPQAVGTQASALVGRSGFPLTWST